MRFRAARATSWSIAMRDYGAHGDRFANKKPHSTAAALAMKPVMVADAARRFTHRRW
jgi:hypothetical protein